MNTLGNLTVLQLQRALEIKQRIESLERELAQLGGGAGNRSGSRRPRRQMSAAARGRIAAAQRARWAKHRKAKPAASASAGKRKMSAAARARIAAAQRRRWAAIKADKGR
jgi:hypothetical protein